MRLSRLWECSREDLDCLPRNINQVSEKEELLDQALSRNFWQNITFDDVLVLIDEFAALMPYKRSEPNPMIVLDMDDIIQQRRMIEYGTTEAPKQEYVESYRKKVESQIKALAENDPTLKKIRDNKPLTEGDLARLEKTLNSPELYVTEEVLQKVYGHTKGTLVQFIKSILGLYEFPDPQKAIEEEFRTFMVEHNQLYSADQINFLRTLQSVFASKKHIDFRDLFEAPFTNLGVNAPIPLFSRDQLDEIVELCNRLEQQLFAEAA